MRESPRLSNRSPLIHLEDCMTSIALPPTALFCNLDDNLSHELSSALHETLHIAATNCSSPGECLEQARQSQPEVLFCPFSKQLISLLCSVDCDRRRIRVLGLTRPPDAHEW